MKYVTYSLATGEIISICAAPNVTSFDDIEVPADQGKIQGAANARFQKVDLDSLEIISRDDGEEYTL